MIKMPRKNTSRRKKTIKRNSSDDETKPEAIEKEYPNETTRRKKVQISRQGVKVYPNAI
jgi:hypothetical protein